MKLRYKVLNGILVVLLVAVGSLAFVISRTDDCPNSPVLAGDTVTMKAIVRRCYGSADVLEYVDVPVPTPAANEVLIKVKAAAVNPLDWHYMRGSPYLMRLGTGLGSPDVQRLGEQDEQDAVQDLVAQFHSSTSLAARCCSTNRSD